MYMIIHIYIKREREREYIRGQAREPKPQGALEASAGRQPHLADLSIYVYLSIYLSLYIYIYIYV